MKYSITILLLSLFLQHTYGSNEPILQMNYPKGVNALIGDISFYKKFGTWPDEKTEEILRIQTHLEYVEQVLRNKSIIHLNKEQQAQRLHLLDLLCDYRIATQFPTNYCYPNTRKPVFIDSDKNICAVGYLVQQTAGQALAEAINKAFKHNYIWEMNHQGLADWVTNSGLTLEECAMIQPAYIIPEPRPRRNANLFALELKKVQVATSITGQSATTELDQVFYNPTSNQLQGYFI